MTDTLVNLASPDKLFIGGEWTSSRGDAGIDIVSPSTEETVGRVDLVGQCFRPRPRDQGVGCVLLLFTMHAYLMRAIRLLFNR